jgi:hypothetical protein
MSPRLVRAASSARRCAFSVSAVRDSITAERALTLGLEFAEVVTSIGERIGHYLGTFGQRLGPLVSLLDQAEPVGKREQPCPRPAGPFGSLFSVDFTGHGSMPRSLSGEDGCPVPETGLEPQKITSATESPGPSWP